MTITSAIVLYSVTWFMTLFCVLPYRTQSQDEAKSVVPGTPPGAPAQEVMRRKAWVTTLIATPIWAVITGIILSGWITVADLDWFGRMDP
jgi:predicted secreted protein